MTVLTQLLSWALGYAEAGFKVFPVHTIRDGCCTCSDADCGSPGKHPRTRNGLKDATLGPDQIERWWSQWPDANIGLRTDGLLVLDYDGGEWPADPAQRLELACAPTAETPRGSVRKGLRPSVASLDRTSGPVRTGVPASRTRGEHACFCAD